MIEDGKRVLIAGASGMGKTWYAENNILNSVIKSKKMANIIIFDPEPSWDIAGFEIVHDFKALVDIAGDCWDTGFRVVYRPNRRGNMPLECHNVSILIDQLQTNYFISGGKVGCPIHYFIDESHFVIGGQYDGVEILSRTGRKRGINLNLLTQGLKDLPPRIRNNIDLAIFFKLNRNANADIETLKSMVGNDYTEQLMNAPEYSYIKTAGTKIELVTPPKK